MAETDVNAMSRNIKRRRPQDVPPIPEVVAGLQKDLKAVYDRLTPGMRDAAKDELSRLALALDGSAERELVTLQARVDEVVRESAEKDKVIANLTRRIEDLTAAPPASPAPTSPPQTSEGSGQAAPESSGDGGGSGEAPPV